MKGYRAGEIALLLFPFAEATGAKRRPALIIRDTGDEDVIVCRGRKTRPWRCLTTRDRPHRSSLLRCRGAPFTQKTTGYRLRVLRRLRVLCVVSSSFILSFVAEAWPDPYHTAYAFAWQDWHTGRAS